jgi:lysophospholipase L1-like esterase
MAARRGRSERFLVVVASVALIGQLVSVAPAAAASAPLAIAPLPNFYSIVANAASENSGALAGAQSALVATGGTPPYTFTRLSGQLPPGMTLAPNGDLLVGATTAGVFQITVKVTDAAKASAIGSVHIGVAADRCVSEEEPGCSSGSGSAILMAPSVSADGSRILFATSDQMLYPSAPPNQFVVRDRPSDKILLASSTSAGVPSPGIGSGQAVISQNGRYVLMWSDWKPDGKNAGIWVKDLTTGQLRLVTTQSAGGGLGAISDDGNVAVYTGVGSLVTVKNLTTKVVYTPDVTSGDYNEFSSMTPDGRYVLFNEFVGLSASGPGPPIRTVLFNTVTNHSTLLVTCQCTVTTNPGRASYSGGISADGRYVSFWSDSQIPYLNPPRDFVLDRTTGHVTPLPIPPGGFNSFFGGDSQMSSDGTKVAVVPNIGEFCIDDWAAKQQSCINDGANNSGQGPSVLSADLGTLAWMWHVGGDTYAIDALDFRAAATEAHRYVAFGDSVPYGHGLANPETVVNDDLPPDQAPSPLAYPSLVALKLGYTMTNRLDGCVLASDQLSVSGALMSLSNAGTGKDTNCNPSQPTKSVLSTELNAARLAQDPPQLVTIQAGANDINFSGCLIYELSGVGTACTSGTAVTSAIAAKLVNIENALTSLIVSIKQATHDTTRIVAVNYYQPVPAQSDFYEDGSGLCLALARTGVTVPRQHALIIQSALNGAIASVIRNHPEVTLVDISRLLGGFGTPTTAHAMCTRAPWLFSGSLGNDWRAVHPTSGGQIAIATAIEAKVPPAS